MKIAYLLSEFPAPSETFIRREIECLTESGTQVVVLAARQTISRESGATGIDPVYRPSRFSIAALKAVWYLAFRYPSSILGLPLLALKVAAECPREALVLLANIHTIGDFIGALDRLGIKNVHACFLSWPACIALALARLGNRRITIAAHARDVFVEPGALRRKAQTAVLLIACTRQGLAELKRVLPPELHGKLRLNRHGIKPPESGAGIVSPQRAFSGNRDKRVVAAVGRFVPKKGFEYLIEAFADLKRRGIAHKLIIVGDGPLRHILEHSIRASGLADSVELRGWVCAECAMESIGEADVLVVPSVIAPDGDRDGIPNVIPEAFALGTPVVATRLPGIQEIVKNRQTGLLVEPGDPKGIAAAVQHLFDNPGPAFRMVEKARAIVESRFSLKANVARLAGLFVSAFEETNA